MDCPVVSSLLNFATFHMFAIRHSDTIIGRAVRSALPTDFQNSGFNLTKVFHSMSLYRSARRPVQLGATMLLKLQTIWTEVWNGIIGRALAAISSPNFHAVALFPTGPLITYG